MSARNDYVRTQAEQDTHFRSMSFAFTAGMHAGLCMIGLDEVPPNSDKVRQQLELILRHLISGVPLPGSNPLTSQELLEEVKKHEGLPISGVPPSGTRSLATGLPLKIFKGSPVYPQPVSEGPLRVRTPPRVHTPPLYGRGRASSVDSRTNRSTGPSDAAPHYVLPKAAISRSPSLQSIHATQPIGPPIMFGPAISQCPKCQLHVPDGKFYVVLGKEASGWVGILHGTWSNVRDKCSSSSMLMEFHCFNEANAHFKNNKGGPALLESQVWCV